MIKRLVEKRVRDYLAGDGRKVLFIWGPRRSGKTTLLNKLGQETGARVFNFDFVNDREVFSPRREKLAQLAKSQPVIMIDEVQNGPEATVALKLLHDEFGVKIVATGSSELRQKSGREFDTLAGRYEEAYCLPLAIGEAVPEGEAFEAGNNWEETAKKMQIFGAYPEIIDNKWAEEKRISELERIVGAYVLKDVVDIYNLRNEKLARDILTKIALQLSGEVSLRELASGLGANVQTVSSYVEIYVKNYVLIPLPSFKTNLRRAVSENRKFYFYDLGVRNALVRDFREAGLRPDNGGVWENFVVSELDKLRRNFDLKLNYYFYREYGGREVDIVVEDYKKNYLCLEVKSGAGRGAEGIFPLPHKLLTVKPENLAETLTAVKKFAGSL
ncbi:MAG: Uncharacterized protein G01um101416_664 [Microgenomates group bacterium Gr01-1014_16]|nr:MAG: Uncharacterized protein G01um101416_664 [Microgenomates group bacterium Gr01-1014_16]